MPRSRSPRSDYPRPRRKPSPPLACLAAFSILPGLLAHPLHDHDEEGHEILAYDRSVTPPEAVAAKPAATAEPSADTPAQAAVFSAFAPKVSARWDERWLYVESDGMPSHPMMIGITAWQQQVPLPQDYSGENAWRIPLRPVAARKPLSAKEHFFRGAIALAANGVPIFNPIKNDGRTDTFLAGELDRFGGHAGRADDYHYHIAPVHLQAVVGNGKPIAYALDGYPIYGFDEPDGANASGLDEFNGHSTTALGYHYHATPGYPYLNGGFHGEVAEADGQVDPQPRARPVRAAQKPLRGAAITGFLTPAPGSYAVEYRIGGEQRVLRYSIKGDGQVSFEQTGAVAATESASVADAAPRPATPKSRGAPEEPKAPQARQPWLKVHAKEMDTDADGTLTRDELAAEVAHVFSGYDRDRDGRVTTDEYSGNSPAVRSAMGGFLKQHTREIDSDGDRVLTKAELQATADRMLQKADADHDGRLSPPELTLPPGYVATPPPGKDEHTSRP